MSLSNKGATSIIGARIRMFREMNGLTQKALGSKLNKGESTVRMWELGRSEPDVETLKLLATEFGISIDMLVGYGDTLAVSPLSVKEQAVIRYYRRGGNSALEIDALVNASEDEIPLYTAADSEDRVADTVIYLKKEEWERIKNAPETDDTLM